MTDSKMMENIEVDSTTQGENLADIKEKTEEFKHSIVENLDSDRSYGAKDAAVQLFTGIDLTGD